MSTRKEQAKSLFLNALEIPGAAERQAYLAAHCGDDEQLRHELKELLSHHQQLGEFLDSPPPALVPTVTERPITESPGTVIGPYKLLEQIGEGGFGVVFMAEQHQPVRRKVALKVIKPGMDTRQVIARFEAERQALALMDHPHIAKVLDAGATDTGRPYFVMELVRGVPITSYCDQHQLSPRERLELFLDVCHAVQHAHQKGIIHRDIKPSNVLVTLHDDKPVVKVIDFGVAKATSGQLTDKTVFTGFAQMIGTPLYMSPEQASMSGLDIDTRSDIYSLGVLLYELLTGTTPFDKSRLQQAAFEEIRRIIRDEEPQKPSTRLSSLGDTLPSVSAQRKMEPRKLSQLMRGDLDWIVMKALEKDRSRRYETANGFAADVLRYLADEPVTACPPSAGYRFRKFARRNKAALATAAMVAAALVAGIIGTTWQAVRATHEADRATHEANRATTAEALAEQRYRAEKSAREQADAARAAEQEQRQIAEQQRQRAEANFAKARAAVDEYLTRVTESELLTVPGLQPLREDLLEAALKFYTAFTLERADDPSLQQELASAHYRIGRIQSEMGNAEASRTANAEAIRLYEQLRDQGQSDRDMQVALARAYFFAGRYDDTVTLCHEALQAEPGHAEAGSLLADTYNQLAVADKNKDNIAAALKYHQQAFELREALVRDHPDNPKFLAQLGGTVNNLGVLLGKQGKTAEALAMFERAADYSAQAYEREPHSLLWGRWLCIGLRNVASNQAALDQEQQALATYQRLVAVSRKRAFDNPAVTSLRGDLSQAHLYLARYQQQLGNSAEGSRSFRAAREVLENIPRETPDQLYDLATAYAALAQPAEGTIQPSQEDAAERQRNIDLALQTLRQAVEAGYAKVQTLKANRLFDVLREQADFQRLVATLENAAEARQLASRNEGTAEQKLADRLRAAGLLSDLVTEGPGALRHRSTLAATLQSMGELQTGLKQFAEAETSLQEGISLWRELAEQQPEQPQLHVNRIASQISLGTLYRESGRGTEAHRAWQACLSDLEQLRAQHAQDVTLGDKIVAKEYQICGIYGRLGAFSFATDFARRSLELRRIYRPILDLDVGIVLAMFQGDEALREVCRLVDRERTKADGRTWTDGELRNLGKVSNLVDPPAVPAGQSLEWIERPARADPNPWHLYLLALAQHRAGKSVEALATLDKVTAAGDYYSLANAGSKLNTAFAGALIAHGAGQTERARERLQKAEAIFVHYCNQTLQENTVGLAPPLSVSGHWWEFTAPVLLRREAWRVIDGKVAPDEAWLRLIEARADHLLGDTAKRDEQLAAAESTDINVWLARARLSEQFDQVDQSAEAAWQKAVELAGDDPRPWIQRGRWYAEHGEQEKADADFAKAASLTPDELNKFLEAGWWVVGPYPEELKEFCPPEVDPDPSQPVYIVDPKTGLSEQPVAWRSVSTSESGEVDLRATFNADHFSAYALNVIYSPDERSATLRVGGDDHVRVWLNGRLVHEARPAGITRLTEDRVPVTLRAGRNILLAKVSQNYGTHFLTVRVTDNPIDRGLALSHEWGLWSDAADQMAEAHSRRPIEAWLWGHELRCLLAAGRQEDYGRRFAEMARDSDHLLEVGHACYLPPARDDQRQRWVEQTEKWAQPRDAWKAFVLGNAYYRAGRFEEAMRTLQESVKLAEGQRYPIAWFLLASTRHQLGQAAEARQCLGKASQQLDDMISTATQSESLRLSEANLAMLCRILSREARSLLQEPAPEQDARLKSLEVQARELLGRWENDALCGHFHRAVRHEPHVARHWLARGQRLAELARWDEAEADFNKAVELKPDDLDALLARARFHAERGDLVKSRQGFEEALQLAGKDWLTLGAVVEREIGLHGDVLDHWQKLDPRSLQLWRIRGERQMRLGQWSEAVQSLSSGDPLYLHESWIGLLDCLLEDQAGYERTCKRHAELVAGQLGDPYFRHYESLRILSAWPGSDHVNELKGLLEAPPDGPWHRFAPQITGLALYRTAQYKQALDVLQKALEPSWSWQYDAMVWPLLAMTHWQLGQVEESRKWLARSEWWIDLTQRATDVPNSVVPYSISYWEWLPAHVFYFEAKALIDGPESAKQAFEQLAKQGQEKRQNAQAQAAAKAQAALANAEAAWQRAVELAGDDPLPWIQRGHWYAERGEHEKADADFARAASLTPNELNRFLEAGWWVVGPYPTDLNEFCPPEVDPDPSQPVCVIDPQTGLSDEPVRWQRVATGEPAAGAQDGRVDLTKFPGRTGSGSVYALNYIFSPDERSVTLHLDKNLPCRVWVNGASTEPASADAVGWLAWTRVPVVLRPGRNTILVRTGSQRFMALLSDAPAARAWELFKFGDFDRAVKAYARTLQSPAHAWIARHACFAALVTGDQAAYREFLKRLPSHSNPALDKEQGILDAEVYASTDVSEADLPRLRSILERWYDNRNRKREPHFERMLAWSHYRLGEFDQAVAILTDYPNEPHMAPVLAMAYHRLGQQDLARQWLARADAVVDQRLNDFAGNGQEGLWLIYPTYRETVALIRGDAPGLDMRFDEFLAQRRRLWDARDPLICAFDDAISNAPSDPHAFVARGRRLAELGRFDDAEADFNKAVDLAPADIDFRLARAHFDAQRGDVDRARTDFDAALKFAGTGNSSISVGAVERELGLHDAVLAEWQKLLPEAAHLWRIRGGRQLCLGNWKEASELFSQGNPHWYHEEFRAALCILLDDAAGYQRACERHAELSETIADPAERNQHRLFMLSLRPIGADQRAEFERLLDEPLKAPASANGVSFHTAIALYRQGRHAEAVAMLDVVFATGGWQYRAQAWPLRALIHWKLGHHDEAHTWLARTERWIDLTNRVAESPQSLGTPHPPPYVWLVAHVFYREAQTLIQAENPSETPDKQDP